MDSKRGHNASLCAWACPNVIVKFESRVNALLQVMWLNLELFLFNISYVEFIALSFTSLLASWVVHFASRAGTSILPYKLVLLCFENLMMSCSDTELENVILLQMYH